MFTQPDFDDRHVGVISQVLIPQDLNPPLPERNPRKFSFTLMDYFVLNCLCQHAELIFAPVLSFSESLCK